MALFVCPDATNLNTSNSRLVTSPKAALWVRAGVVIDALRCAKVALDRGISGPLEAVSACSMKHPPRQMRDSEARDALERFIAGK